MKILVAPDSFKESLSAIKVSNAITKGILNIIPDAKIIQVPVSDGGEGLLEVLLNELGGKRVSRTVKDPLNRDIQAEYGILNDNSTAIIEIAQASGLELLRAEERNPELTSSFGSGQLIKDALDKGCRKIIIGIGGSATNDGGMGMIKALGGKFFNEKLEELGDGGKALGELNKIDISEFDSRIRNCKITVACDVTNPLTGQNGASLVYGRQKGGTKEQLQRLDKNLKNYASVIHNDLNIEVETKMGAGAAGGIGAGLMAFFNAELKRGIDLVIDMLEIKKHLKNVNLLITGEGKIDRQTLHGKAIIGLASLARENMVPVIAITGKKEGNIDEIYTKGITAVFSIVNKPLSLREAIVNAENLIESCVENIFRIIKLHENG
ncbi:MAG: glycerate kinase [Flavobacteriaceae bacterium]|nr:glycerate kinase [Flavobacteriaceae bacterium]